MTCLHFFKHDNQHYPPSLSDGGKLRIGKKSDLLGNLNEDPDQDPPVYFDAKFLDGAAVVHLLPVTSITTFDDYAHRIFIPNVIKQLENTTRVDVVWDTYIPNSIKESTRERRGTGIRRKVAEKKNPGNWSDFLRDPTNKQELFVYLSTKVSNINVPHDK